MHLNHHAGLLAFVDHGPQNVQLFFGGPGTGVSAISPVNLTPMSAIFRISARAVSGVWLFSRNEPEGMIARSVDEHHSRCDPGA